MTEPRECTVCRGDMNVIRGGWVCPNPDCDAFCVVKTPERIDDEVEAIMQRRQEQSAR